jgi:large subunit ribosomal protein L21
MFAIIEASGKQYRVAAGETITVDRMADDEGETITLDRVLMIGGDAVKIGTPTVEGATVTARVVAHRRGNKVIAFKYRPRQRYRRRVGYRHSHTDLEIVSIDA